jgi:predicted DNA-binding transcriptional regulator YafY
MKKFMSSQKFFEKVDDEVVFTLEYTQELEILPFIKRWLPDLIILEPKELKDRLDEDLRSYLSS